MNIDLTTIPTGTDGKPDRDQLIALMEQQLARLKQTMAQREDYYTRQFDEIKCDTVELARLRKREVRVLERWVRRRAIIKLRVERMLLIAAGAMVAIPLFMVLVGLAWKLLIWVALS